MKIRLLSANDIDQALPMEKAVDINAGAYQAVSMGEAVMPQRARVETTNGPMLVMPAFMKDSGAMAVKIVTVFPENAKKELPVIHALALALDGETGEPLALMNGERLTAKRTGAGVGAATRMLARRDAEVMAIIGAGAQAADQIKAVLAVRPIKEVRIVSKLGRSARNLAVRLGLEIEGVKFWAPKTLERALRDADVITAVTTSATPVFDASMISPGTHINGVGAFSPDMVELPVCDLEVPKVFVDSRKAVRAEAGDVIKAIREKCLNPDDLVEIGEVIAGAEPGRRGADEITVFKSVGVAAQDAVTAREILIRAEEMDLGTRVEL